jgi:hypothetical protein
MPWQSLAQKQLGRVSARCAPFSDHRASPTMRLMSKGFVAAARNSRKPVALVDFASFWPASSRMSL